MIFLHRDDHLVVVAKPSGVLVHRGSAPDRDVMLTRVRDAVGRRVYPVHRLDRGTSGALLFALDEETARALGDAFTRGAVSKTYLALVRGHAPEAITVDHPVPRSEGGERVPAVTDLRLLWASPNHHCSLVLAQPRTGRFHQIRRHLKHLSHPIIGDVNYGDGRVNRQFRTDFGLHRLALHARGLLLVHPSTRANISIVAPIPDDLRAPLLRAGVPPVLLDAPRTA